MNRFISMGVTLILKEEKEKRTENMKEERLIQD